MVSALVPELVLPGGLMQGVRHGGHNCVSKVVCLAPPWCGGSAPCVVWGIGSEGAQSPGPGLSPDWGAESVGVGVSGLECLCWAGLSPWEGGWEVSFIRSVNVILPIQGPTLCWVLDTLSSCDIAEDRGGYRPTCKPIATLGHFR